MDRMTLPHYDGKGYYMKCSEQFGCSGECTDCEELDKLVQRLAEYENKAEQQPTTKADRIRAMSNEELTEHEVRTTQDEMYYECSDGEIFAIYEDAIAYERAWLKQPVEE